MKRKTLAILVGLLVAISMVSAGIIEHFDKLEANINAETPIELDQTLFVFDGEEVLNDGQNHYLLIKGQNKLNVEIPATAVITITAVDEEDVPFDVDGVGLHFAIDAGGDMHYCYDPAGDMTNVTDCDTDYVQWLINNNNPDWFDWLGTDATYEDSGFVDPIVNHGGNSFYNIDIIGGTWANGVITIPGVDPDPGLIAALLVVRADPGLKLGTYTIKVELKPVI